MALLTRRLTKPSPPPSLVNTASIQFSECQPTTTTTSLSAPALYSAYRALACHVRAPGPRLSPAAYALPLQGVGVLSVFPHNPTFSALLRTVRFILSGLALSFLLPRTPLFSERCLCPLHFPRHCIPHSACLAVALYQIHFHVCPPGLPEFLVRTLVDADLRYLPLQA